jgi:hypothetical protein
MSRSCLSSVGFIESGQGKMVPIFPLPRSGRRAKKHVNVDLQLLYAPMAVFIEKPLLAALPLAVFLVLYAVSQKVIILAAAAAWLAYLPYEYGMKLRILCTGECNIRIDLLVLYPALVLISVVAVLAFLRSLARQRRFVRARGRGA